MNGSHHVVVVYGLGAHVGPRVQGVGGGGLGCTVLMYVQLSSLVGTASTLGLNWGVSFTRLRQFNYLDPPMQLQCGICSCVLRVKVEFDIYRYIYMTLIIMGDYHY